MSADAAKATPAQGRLSDSAREAVSKYGLIGVLAALPLYLAITDLASTGTLTDLVWSPGGERLLVSWQQADQWVFVPVDGSPEPQAVADISAQFAPGEPTPALPAISGWIQPQR